MTQTELTPIASRTGKWKPYPAYKDSGVEWLGEIPAHWELWKVTHSFGLIGSGSTPLTSREEYYGGDIPWVNTAELRDNLINNTSKKLTEKALIDFPTLRVFSIGTLLVALYGATIGRIGILQIPTATNQACCALSEPKHLSVDFTFYWFLAHRQQLILLASGGGQPNISQDIIRSLRISAPPLPEQHAIATFLDRETARINTLIAKKERLIKLLQEKRAALISHAVTKGLDPTVPMRDSGVEWLGEIPAHWEVKRMKFVAKQETGHTPSRQHPEYWENCTIPWISLADVWQLRNGHREYIEDTNEYISELGLANSSAKLLPAGTVIVSRTASVGFSGIMARPMATTQDFANWICGPLIRSEFLLYVLRSMEQEFRRLVMGSTHQTIYMPDIRRFITSVPPRHEQDAIVGYIRKETAKIDALISRIHEGIEKLKEYSSALISAAVTGKIDVRGETA